MNVKQLVSDNGIERFVVLKVGLGERVAALDVELVVIDVVQEHVHAGEVVGGVINLLHEEALLDCVLWNGFVGF